MGDSTLDDVKARLDGLTFGLEMLLGNILDELAGSRPDGEAMLLRMLGTATARIDDFLVDIMPPAVDADHREVIRTSMTGLVRGAFRETSISPRIVTGGDET